MLASGFVDSVSRLESRRVSYWSTSAAEYRDVTSAIDRPRMREHVTHSRTPLTRPSMQIIFIKIDVVVVVQ